MAACYLEYTNLSLCTFNYTLVVASVLLFTSNSAHMYVPSTLWNCLGFEYSGSTRMGYHLVKAEALSSCTEVSKSL